MSADLSEGDQPTLVWGTSLYGMPAMEVRYTNYRGRTDVRRILPKALRYGSTEHHPETQWLLLADDLDRGVERVFALRDMVPLGAAGAEPTKVASATLAGQPESVAEASVQALLE